MLVVTRFRDPAEPAEFLGMARDALAVLAARPGYRWGQIGRAVDDPSLWMLATEWSDVGSYRRALGSVEVRMGAWRLLASACDEPTAFEVLHADPGAEAEAPAGGRRTDRAADADTVGLGHASAPSVPTDLPPAGE